MSAPVTCNNNPIVANITYFIQTVPEMRTILYSDETTDDYRKNNQEWKANIWDNFSINEFL